jgi:V8-like Glu-specific endopeptidase
MLTVLALAGLSSESFATKKIVSLIEEQGMKHLSKQDKISLLFNGIAPTKKVKQEAIPKNFFLENDPEYKSEKLNEKITVFSRIKEIEKEKYIQNIKQKRKDFALLTQDSGGNYLDRRTKVEDILKFPYLPICYLGIHYKMPTGEVLKFVGTGYRNGLNQIMTAGHNLFLEESDVEQFLLKSNQKQFTFSKQNLFFEILFGLDKDHLLPRHIYKISGVKSYKMDNKDFGIIDLPQHAYKQLNDEIGFLTLKHAPDYIDKQEVSVIGYPGEKMKQMYKHKGALLQNTFENELEYDVDTSRGNSGSPIFEGEDESKESFKVIGTHTHHIPAKKLNGGQGINDDITEFMTSLK